MYYERLEKHFKENQDLNEKYSSRIIEKLDDFIRDELQNGYSFLNPYKFAFEESIGLEDSLKIFLAYTNDVDENEEIEERLFQIEPFVDCPTCTGIELRILPQGFIDEGYIFCEDCRREYILKHFEKHIYYKFKLNDGVSPPEQKRVLDKYDPNLTSEVIKRMSDSLKGESLLSSSNPSKVHQHLDERDIPKAVSSDDISKSNKQGNGDPINKSVCKLDEALMNELINEAS
jgi:hypothetical protein